MAETRPTANKPEILLAAHRPASQVENLDWCISYLHQIRKHAVANALRKNRMTIVERYRGS